jgi:Mce-associated membrane protein
MRIHRYEMNFDRTRRASVKALRAEQAKQGKPEPEDSDPEPDPPPPPPEPDPTAGPGPEAAGAPVPAAPVEAPMSEPSEEAPAVTSEATENGATEPTADVESQCSSHNEEGLCAQTGLARAESEATLAAVPAAADRPADTPSGVAEAAKTVTPGADAADLGHGHGFHPRDG